MINGAVWLKYPIHINWDRQDPFSCRSIIIHASSFRCSIPGRFKEIIINPAMEFVVLIKKS